MFDSISKLSTTKLWATSLSLSPGKGGTTQLRLSQLGLATYFVIRNRLNSHQYHHNLLSFQLLRNVTRPKHQASYQPSLNGNSYRTPGLNKWLHASRHLQQGGNRSHVLFTCRLTSTSHEITKYHQTKERPRTTEELPSPAHHPQDCHRHPSQRLFSNTHPPSLGNERQHEHELCFPPFSFSFVFFRTIASSPHLPHSRVAESRR